MSSKSNNSSPDFDEEVECVLTKLKALVLLLKKSPSHQFQQEAVTCMKELDRVSLAMTVYSQRAHLAFFATLLVMVTLMFVFREKAIPDLFLLSLNLTFFVFSMSIVRSIISSFAYLILNKAIHNIDGVEKTIANI